MLESRLRSASQVQTTGDQELESDDDENGERDGGGGKEEEKVFDKIL